MKEKTYKAHPIVENPMINQIDNETMIAWFRCNSCFTCRFREKVIDPDPHKTIHWCSKTHEKHNIVDMVEFLGYSKE